MTPHYPRTLTLDEIERLSYISGDTATHAVVSRALDEAYDGIKSSEQEEYARGYEEGYREGYVQRDYDDSPVE